MNLGESIYRLRSEKNMSQGDLADALEVSRQSVSKWENNAATPELEQLMNLSELFAVTLDELVTGRCQNTEPAAAEEVVVSEEAEKEDPAIRSLRFAVITLAIGIALIVNGVLLGFLSELLRSILCWCAAACFAAAGVGMLFLIKR